jgi:hypothetical protein
MRRAEPTTETEQVHHPSENLMAHLAKGREWATPGVQVALQRAVAGLVVLRRPHRASKRFCAGWLTILLAAWRH